MTYPQEGDKVNTLQFATQWRRFLPFIVGGVGIMLVGAGILVNYINSTQSTSTSQEDQSGEGSSHMINENENTQSLVKGVNSVKLIKVDISGAVQKPGLVEIPVDSRVQDVLISAGGFDAKADRMYISRSINLAQVVQDGMKIYVPFEGEKVNTPDAANGSSESGFNINSASQAKLEELPGIGPVTAKKIVEGRPYGAIEELVSKKVVSKSVYDKIKTTVSLY